MFQAGKDRHLWPIRQARHHQTQEWALRHGYLYIARVQPLFVVVEHYTVNELSTDYPAILGITSELVPEFKYRIFGLFALCMIQIKECHQYNYL